MPELPEVETVRRTLEPHLVGRRILKVSVRDKRLRVPVDVRALGRLAGRSVTAIRRRSKYLLIDLEGDLVLMIHLGMSGSLGVGAQGRTLATHDHVVWEIEPDRLLWYNDPRRFGLVQTFARATEAEHPSLAHLGVEPLAGEFTAEAFHAATRGKAKPIKNFLMDGNHVVGVGNIYACEALFRAGVHPGAAAGRLSLDRCRALVSAVSSTLEEAITQGGTTLRDFQNADGEIGYFAIRLNVYGREGELCPNCERPIRRIVQSGRSTFYCPKCQPKPR